MNDTFKKKKFIICSCGSSEHSVLLRYDEEDDEVFMEPTLRRLPFLERLKLAWKYILGQDGGMFAEIILSRKEIDELSDYFSNLNPEK